MTHRSEFNNCIMKTIYTLLLAFAPAVSAWSQCCSAGNPLGGSANVGAPDAGTLRTVAFLRHSYSDTYYAGSRKAEFQGTTAGYYYFGTVLAYGFTERLTAETELGLFLDKRKKDPSLAPEQAWAWPTAQFRSSTVFGKTPCGNGNSPPAPACASHFQKNWSRTNTIFP